MEGPVGNPRTLDGGIQARRETTVLAVHVGRQKNNMNRRNVLKGLAALPLTALTESYSQSYAVQKPRAVATRTLQIILEGAFALVLQSKTGRLTAFVPRHGKHIHQLYFNDPLKPQKNSEQEYYFELAGEGLVKYSETYVNPGFHDFEVHAKQVKMPGSLVKIDLPLPGSINFSGRPLHVIFARGRRKGLMPTSHILEYQIEREELVKMTCRQIEGECSPSPYAPPGVRRFFFGVDPVFTEQQACDPKYLTQHAVDFFNFMLEAVFPREHKHQLLSIEPAYKPCPAAAKETAAGAIWTRQVNLVPAVLRAAEAKPRLLTVSSTVDCQGGGIIGHVP